MVDSVQSGYKAAAQAVVFSGTQTLASLANDEYTDVSDAIDNSSTKYMMADFYLDLASITVTAGTDGVDLYLLPSVDDTNYPDWNGNVATDEVGNEKHYVGSFLLEDGTAVKDAVLRSVVLPPGKFKVAVRNRAIAFAASGNTLYWRPWQYGSA